MQGSCAGSPQHDDTLAVVLIGHGVPATDCPPELVGQLMSLEWRHAVGGPPNGPASSDGHPRHSRQGVVCPSDEVRGRQAAELDAQIRNWPRHAGNDPYKVGLERLAEVLRPLLPTKRFAIGYNEFCRPSIPEAVEAVIRDGATRVLVLSTMLTPGGVHSEQDIPQALARIRQAHPGLAIEYLWPFDLQQVAGLLASHVTRAIHAVGLGEAR